MANLVPMVDEVLANEKAKTGQGFMPKPLRMRCLRAELMIEYIVFRLDGRRPAMSTMTMRVDDVDAAIVRKYAKFEGHESDT